VVISKTSCFSIHPDKETNRGGELNFRNFKNDLIDDEGLPRPLLVDVSRPKAH